MPDRLSTAIGAIRARQAHLAATAFAELGVSILAEIARTGGFSVTTTDSVSGKAMRTTVTVLGDVTMHVPKAASLALRARHDLAVEHALGQLRRSARWLAAETQGVSWAIRMIGIAGGGTLSQSQIAASAAAALQGLLPLSAETTATLAQVISAFAAYGIVTTAGKLVRRALIGAIRARLHRLMS
jgi:hypothetical protein